MQKVFIILQYYVILFILKINIIDARKYIMNNNHNNKPSGNRSGRRPLTREQAILAERRRAEKRQRQKETKMLIDKAVAVGILSIIGVAICLVIIFSYIFVDFRSHEKAPDDPVKVTYEKDKTVVLNKDYYSYKNGEYYISLTKLSEICSFTLHGNSKSMTLTVSERERATFNTGTPEVKIGSVYSVLKNPSYFSGGHLFIPVSFFEDMCNGIQCDFDRLGKVKGLNIIFSKDFSFKVLSSKENDSIQYNKAPAEKTSDTPSFKSNLSRYEMYMNPENKDDFLFIVNSSNKLSKDYVPEGLFEISDTRSDRAKEKMVLYAAKALEALFIEMRANGFYDMGVISGYRSYEYQKTMLENETEAFLSQCGGDKEKARELALSHVSLPGTSEHQSGLCVDISTSNVLSESLSETSSYKWLYSNCADFGFILRYPKDKTDITGVSFEPWHFRYVGRYHAQKIMSEGLCLEEYLETLN